MAAQVTGAPRAGVRPEAADLLRKICDKVLAPYGLAESAQRAKAAAGSQEQKNTVILVGEINRGKSALANALVGVDGASPAGPDFTTAVPVAIGPATPEVPAGYAALLAGNRAEIVPAAELGAYIGRDSQSGAGFVPTRAYVAVAHSALGNATVIDEPGIGGIDAMTAMPHADTHDHASVVVVVTDASTPLTRPEMEFLRTASDRNASVVVAVTKTDKNLTRFRQIVREDEDLILEHVGRDIPVLPLSSVVQFLPEFTEAGAHGQQGATGVETAGVAELRRAIAARFTRAGSLPLANGLRIAAGGLEQIDDGLLEHIEALKHAEDCLPELQKRTAELEELIRTKETWQEYLVRDMTIARRDAMERLDADLTAVKNSWLSFIDSEGMKVLRRDPQHYTRRVEEDFQRAVVSNVEAFTQQIGQLVRARFRDAALAESVTDEILSNLVVGEMESVAFERKLKDAFDPMLLMMGMSGGSMLGTVLGASVFAGVGMVAGVGWFGVNAAYRSMKHGKSQLQQWLRETAAAAQKHTAGIYDRLAAEARAVIMVRYRVYLEHEIEKVRGIRKQVEQAQAQEAKQREEQVQRDERKRRTVMRLRERVEELIEALLEEAAEPVRQEEGE